MAQPHPQASYSFERGAAGKPALAHGQVAGRTPHLGDPAKLGEPADPTTAPGETNEAIAAPASEKDWGLTPPRKSRFREVKIGLLLLLPICLGFGYVVHRHLKHTGAGVADATELAVSLEGATDAGAGQLAVPDAATTTTAITQTNADFSAKDAGVPTLPIRTVAIRAQQQADDPFGDLNQEEPVAQDEPASRDIPGFDAPQAEPGSRQVAQNVTDGVPGRGARGGLEITEIEDDPTNFDPTLGGQQSEAGSGAISGSTNDTALNAPSDRPETLSPASVASAIAAPPTLDRLEAGEFGDEDDSSSTSDSNVASMPKLTGPQLQPPVTDEKMGGFEVDPVEPARTAKPDRPVVESPDDVRYGGYEPADVGRVRAASRTVVKRVAAVVLETPPSRSTPLVERRPIEIAANDAPAAAPNVALDIDTVPIMPRHATNDTVPVQRRAGAQTPAIPPLNEPSAPPKRRELPPLPSFDSPAANNAATAPRTPSRPRIDADFSTSAVSPAAPSDSPLTADESYTVLPNDNFWKISKRQYGTARYFLALTKHNQSRISDPTHMRPGLLLSTPPKQVLEARYPELIDKNPAAEPGQPSRGAASGSETGATQSGPSGFFVGSNGEPLYRVGHDDTLSGISQKHLGRSSRWVEIFEHNQATLKTPDALKIGTVIRLPPNASRLSMLVPDIERR